MTSAPSNACGLIGLSAGETTITSIPTTRLIPVFRKPSLQRCKWTAGSCLLLSGLLSILIHAHIRVKTETWIEFQPYTVSF